MPNITNPAAEIYALCIRLNGSPGKDATRDVLAKLFSVSTDDSEFYAILTAISARFDKVADLIALALQHAPPQKQTAISAVSHLRGFVRPHALHTSWDTVRMDIFRPEFLSPIHMVDPMVQAIAPIALPTSEEKQRILSSLEEAIGSLLESDSIAATTLAVSLRALKKIIDKLEFFGMEELFRQIMDIDVRFRAAQKNAANQSGSKVRTALRKVAMVMSVILTALTVSDAAFTAVENDYQRCQNLIEFISSDIEISPLQLTASSPLALPEDQDRPDSEETQTPD